jgi:hypothetical protein
MPKKDAQPKYLPQSISFGRKLLITNQQDEFRDLR